MELSWELSWVVLFEFLFMYFLFCGHVVFGGHAFFYIAILILWYVTCFEVDMNLCMDKFIL